MDDSACNCEPLVNAMASPGAGGSEPVMCQICYDDGDTKLYADLCKCRGSVGYVHIDCLRDWLQKQRQSIANDDWQLVSSVFARRPRCSVCNAPYSDRVTVTYKWRPLRLWRLQRHLFTVLLYAAVFILLITFSFNVKISFVHLCALVLYATSAFIWWLGFAATNKDVIVTIV